MPSTRNALFAAACALLVVPALATPGDVLLATSGFVQPNLLSIDPTTGGVLGSLPISNEEALFGGLTFDGSALYSIDGYNDPNSDRTFRIDPTTAAGSVVGDTGFNWNFRSVEIHPISGVLYATTDNRLHTLDKTTGTASVVADITGSTLDQATALAIDAAGQAYMTDIGGQGLFRLDLTSGVLTKVGDVGIAPSGWFQDLAFDSAGTLWGVWWTGGLYTIDTATASATLKLASGAYGGIAFRCDTQVTTYCTPKAGLACGPPSIRAAGCASASASSGFTISAGPARPAKSGILIHSDQGPASLPFQGGVLCVNPPLRRSVAVSSGGTPGLCDGVFTLDVNCYAAGACGGNPASFLGSPGTQMSTQWWGRDSVATGSFLSDGLTYVVGP
jgi:hypothetical protein